jgi:membrane associated rhomboid family serine protease
MGVRDELSMQWRNGGSLVRLLLINVGVFLWIHAIGLVFFIIQYPEPDILRWLASTSDLGRLVRTPWTVITYMFTHYDVFHLFFNMLMLWFSGRLFGDLLGGKRLAGNYILGGLAGLALYIISFNLFPAFTRFAAGSSILGASAAVMAVFVGIAAYAPDLEVNLLFFGRVRLKWLALIYVVIDLISLKQMVNSGGHIAHLGGALYGYLAAMRLKRSGGDWSLAFVQALERMAGFLPIRSRRLRVAKSGRERVRVMKDEEWNASRRARQERIDAILDKISRSGYDSLTKEERDTLFKASHEK